MYFKHSNSLKYLFLSLSASLLLLHSLQLENNVVKLRGNRVGGWESESRRRKEEREGKNRVGIYFPPSQPLALSSSHEPLKYYSQFSVLISLIFMHAEIAFECIIIQKWEGL